MRTLRDGNLLAAIDDKSPDAMLRREATIDHLLILAEADAESIEQDLARAVKALARAKAMRQKIVELKRLVDEDRAATRTTVRTVKVG